MFFNKSRPYDRPSIELAYMMLHGAMYIIQGYGANKMLKPSHEELVIFRIFIDELHKSHAVAEHIFANLQRHMEG